MNLLKQVKVKLSKLDKSSPGNVKWNPNGAEVSSKDLYQNNKELIQIARSVFTKAYESAVKQNGKS